MSETNYALLLKENKNLIEVIKEFVADDRFINDDRSDDGFNEFGLYYGFVSHGLNSLPVLCAESINKNLIGLETNSFLSWEKEQVIEQVKLLIDLYFDKLCEDGCTYGAFFAKQIADWFLGHYPKECKNTYIESSLFTKEYLLKILYNNLGTYKLSMSYAKDDKKEKAKEKMPFKIGLEFAKGKIQKLYKLYKQEEYTFDDITKESGFSIANRPYFSETLNENNSPKNIYKNKKVMLLIEEHCVENKIEMCLDFKVNLEKIKFEL